MAYTIKDGCIACDSCRPNCPTGAIKPKEDSDGYWIDPTLCDNCSNLDGPQCLDVCEIGSLSPLVPKKGRLKSTLLPAAISEIFLSGKTTPFASSMVSWEACNILAQRQHLPWNIDTDGTAYYSRPVHRGRGEMRFRLMANPESHSLKPMTDDDAAAALEQLDIRASCLHLIFAAYAVTLNCPWDEPFVLNDQHIEQYLGLDKRKDLTKLDKLTLIKTLVHQACQLLVTINWPRQGKVKAFAIDEQPIWHLLDTEYYFEQDAQGDDHLIGLGFKVQAGIWTKHFLNKQDYRNHTAFYQYGTLPKSLLTEVMSNWQQHEGSVRILLWLLFKLRLGSDHRLTVRTLLRIAYGEARLTEATTVRGAHKRLLKTFESDLETIYYYGLIPIFDEATYPVDIQPLWARAVHIPNDVDDALEFWVNDANRSNSLTATAPRDKWQRLINARLSGFELSEEWQQTIRRRAPKRRRKKTKPVQLGQISGDAIKAARQRQKFTQRALAERLGKSQSWVRDVEKGRFGVNAEDYVRLQQALNI